MSQATGRDAPSRSEYIAAVVDDVLVLVVPGSVIDDRARAAGLLARARRALGREVVLVSPTRRFRVTFYGRADLADAVHRAPLDRARWTRLLLDDRP